MPSELIFEISPNLVDFGDTISFKVFNNFLVEFTSSPILSDKYDFDDAPATSGFVTAFNTIQSLNDYYIATGTPTEVTITARFEDSDYNFRDFNTTSPNVTLISITDAGQGGVPVPTTPDAITVNSVDFDLPELYTPATQNQTNPFGSVKDLQNITINFDITSSPALIRFQYGWIPNDIDPYNGSTTNFELGDNNFLSLYDESPQGFSGGLGTLDFLSPKSSQQGDATFTDLGGVNYEIEHNTFINPFIRNEDLDSTQSINASVPDFLEGSASIKYVFKIEAYDSIADSTPYATTDIVNLTGVFNNGVIAWYNETLNGNIANYSLESFSFDNDQNVLDSNNDTTGEAVIVAINGNFAVTDKLILVINEIPDETNETSTFNENLNLERLEVFTDGVVVNGTKLTNVSATIQGGDPEKFDLQFTVPSGSVSGNYEISATVVKPNEPDVNHTNVLLVNDTTALLSSSGDYQLVNPGGAPYSNFNVLPHYLNDISDISNSFNYRNDYVQDKSLYVFAIQELNPDKTVTDFQLQLVDDVNNIVYDNVTLFLSDFPINRRRDYKTGNNDDWGLLEAFQMGDTYFFNVGIMPWEETPSASSLRFRATVNGTQLANDGVTTISFSECFEETNSVPSDYDDPNGSNVSLVSVQFQDADTLNVLGGLNQTGNTIITATFKDTITNDLETDEADLFGELGIAASGTSINGWRFLNNKRSPESDSPWLESLAVVTKTAIDTATVVGTIDRDKLLSAFPTGEDFEFTFRLDRIQALSEPVTRYLSIPLREKRFDPSAPVGDPVGYEAYFQQPEQFSNTIVIGDFFVNNFDEFLYKFLDEDPLLNPGTYPNGWDDVAEVTRTDWITSLESQTDYYYYASTEFNQGGYVDTSILVQYDSLTGVLLDTGFNFPNDCIDTDTVISFDRKVVINSITDSNNVLQAGRFGLRTNAPQNEDYTIFDLDLAGINSAIDALTENTKYNIHFTGIKEPLNEAVNLVIDYSFITDPSEQKSLHINTGDVNAEYRQFTTNNQCVRFGTNNDFLPQFGQTDNDTALNDLFDYTQNNAYTVSWWGRTRDEADPQVNSNSWLTVFAPQGAPPNSGIYMRLKSQLNNVIQFIIRETSANSKAVEYNFGTNMTFNQLTNLIFTYDGSGNVSGMNCYYNGRKFLPSETTVLVDGTISNPTVPSTGDYRHGDDPFVSPINNNPQCTERIQVYDSELNSFNIRRIYNNPNYFRDIIGANSLFRDYDFSDGTVNNGLTIPDLENGVDMDLVWLGSPAPRFDFYEDLN